VLLRAPDGAISFISFAALQQVDLTDDDVVAALFAGGSWERAAQALQAREADGTLAPVRLDADTFRDIVSVLE